MSADLIESVYGLQPPPHPQDTPAMRAALAQIIMTLDNPWQRAVLKRRFGLDGYTPHTLREIAAAEHITLDATRQIEARALRLVRNHAHTIAR